MEEREVLGHILERDVVRDDVAIEPRGQRLAQIRVGVEEQLVRRPRG